ncbi:MAG: hypothetical protein HDQ99_02660 [Lachnospiraceae bacterium]|nr:hypothetical protein [Lachnospiraceae bacterium]
MEIILTIVFIVTVWFLCKTPEWKHDNRICPPGKEIDYKKANHDLSVGGISKQEYFRRYNSGYYDKDKK